MNIASTIEAQEAKAAEKARRLKETAERRAARWEHIARLRANPVERTPVKIARPDPAPYDPVFDYTAASHSYFWRW